MRKSAARLALSFIFLTAVTLLSCNNSVEDMLGDYNSDFTWTYVTISETQATEETVKSPGDEGFDPYEMLREVYALQYDSTLNLAGPPNNVYSYKWTVYDPKNSDSVVNVVTMNGRLDTQYFVIYVPDSGLETDHTYHLKLEITTEDSRYYYDDCSIVIYPHYIYE